MTFLKSGNVYLGTVDKNTQPPTVTHDHSVTEKKIAFLFRKLFNDIFSIETISRRIIGT
jgi:hypothetical protein